MQVEKMYNPNFDQSWDSVVSLAGAELGELHHRVPAHSVDMTNIFTQIEQLS